MDLGVYDLHQVPRYGLTDTTLPSGMVPVDAPT
jgi:hypothetical protein